MVVFLDANQSWSLLLKTFPVMGGSGKRSLPMGLRHLYETIGKLALAAATRSMICQSKHVPQRDTFTA
jgi:hypothetical protein